MSVSASHAPASAARTRTRPERTRSLGFGPRAIVVTVLLLSIAIGTTAVAIASAAAFGRTLSTTVNARLVEVAGEIARHIDYGLRAGIALEQQFRLIEILDVEDQGPFDLSAIHVLDPDGRILFSTRRADVGERYPEALEPNGLSTIAGPDDEAMYYWQEADRETIGIGLLVPGLFGEPVGTVVVEAPRQAIDDQRQRYAIALALLGGAITVLGGTITVVLVALFPLRDTTTLRTLVARLKGLYAAAGEPAPPVRTPEPQGPVPIDETFTTFEASLQARMAGLGGREAEVRRLDETA